MTQSTYHTSMLPNFRPVSRLWEGENPPYPSEQSARWAIRQMKHELAAAEAIALHRGRTFVNPNKFGEVAERIAIDLAKTRWAR